MMLVLALAMLGMSIAVIFSQEFVRIFKKIASIPGVTLLVPLAFASWFIELYEDWGHWLLLRWRVFIDQGLHAVALALPFGKASHSFARILFLFLLATVPVWLARLVAKKRGIKRPLTQSYRVGLVLWVIAVIVLSVAL